MARFRQPPPSPSQGEDDPNDPPVVTGPVTQTFTEDDAAANVQLIDSNVSDPDNDTLSVVSGSLSLVSGDATGIVPNEGSGVLAVTPGAYGALNSGQSAVVIYSYQITDSVNTPVNQTATITITGINDDPGAPVLGTTPLTVATNEDANPFTFDLLTDATDTEQLNVDECQCSQRATLQA